jgi:hypothetical protein
MICALKLYRFLVSGTMEPASPLNSTMALAPPDPNGLAAGTSSMESMSLEMSVSLPYLAAFAASMPGIAASAEAGPGAAAAPVCARSSSSPARFFFFFDGWISGGGMLRTAWYSSRICVRKFAGRTS